MQPFRNIFDVGRDRGLWLPESARINRQMPDSRRIAKLVREFRGRRFSTTENIAYGTYTAMTVANLQSLAADATDTYTAWQSARVDNQTSVKATDYEIFVKLPLTTGTIGGDQAAYVYVVPWVTTDGGTTWVPGANFGTTTEPTGTEGTAVISEPNSMKGPLGIPAKVQSQNLELFFTIGQLCGGVVPDGWSLVIRDNTGINLTTGCVVAYRAITYVGS